MKLFDDFQRYKFGAADGLTNQYDFYNNTAEPKFVAVRDQLNLLFDNFPIDHQHSLKSSFKKQFEDSFYELFLYNLFLKLGYEIEVHPTLEDSTKKPDFLIKKGNVEIYVEAKIAKNISEKEEKTIRKKETFYNEINKIRIAGFFLNIDKLEFKNELQPPTKMLKKHIQSEIIKFDKDKVLEEIEMLKTTRTNQIIYEDDNLKIVIFPIPITKEISEEDEKARKPIGMYPFETFYDGGEDSLKSSIRKKASRYGKLDKPYIVCVNALSYKTSTRMDVDNAIWGSLTMVFEKRGTEEKTSYERSVDGVFCDEKGIKNSQLSGVMITKVLPHSPTTGMYWLYENPYKDTTLNFEDIGLKYNKVVDGFIHSTDGDDLETIMS